MLPTNSRSLIGPFITLVSVIGIFAANNFLFTVPSPVALLLLTVVMSAAIGGVRPGLTSALVSLTGVPATWLKGGLLPPLQLNDIANLALLMIAAPICAVVIGKLRESAIHARHRVQQLRFAAHAPRRELTALRAGLDRIEVGMVLLDQGRNAQFINRAFRRIWRLPDELDDNTPSFAKLMLHHDRHGKACPIPTDQFDACIAKQLEAIRTGDERPVDIRLANGEVYRFGCKALPDGGRFLSYGNVTDLISHAEMLEEFASVDGLTRLYNRRHFLTLAEKEWARFRRYGTPLAMLILDIDLFKSINDRYGHDIGDRVLIEAADVLRSKKRVSDIVGRLGGEEFALLLPEISLESACAAADRLRRAIADRVIVVEDAAISVTISIGVSVTREGIDGIAELIKEADVALYDAKRSGRNRVCVFDRAKAGVDAKRIPDIRPARPALIAEAKSA